MFSKYSYQVSSYLKLKHLGAALLAAPMLLSCASSNLSFDSLIGEDNKEDWHTLYLRGVFTWWEADESFKVKQVKPELFMVSAELVADGQPYDFKFADKNWTPGLRCGYSNKEKDEELTLGSVSEANCDTPVDNFRFTPSESGTYNFYFDVKNQNAPLVYIKKKPD